MHAEMISTLRVKDSKEESGHLSPRGKPIFLGSLFELVDIVIKMIKSTSSRNSGGNTIPFGRNR